SFHCLRSRLLKPRLGRRRCSGIWPPSKPPMATPERAVWPLPPRPPVLPMPEPMPRPTRRRSLRDPGLSLISFSRMTRCTPGLMPCYAHSTVRPDLGSGLLVDHPHQVADLPDHAAHLGGVGQRAPAVQLVEAEPHQGLLLDLGAPVGARDLLDGDGLL